MPHADVLEPFALRVAAPVVAREGVERTAAERHLTPAVGAADRGEAVDAGRSRAARDDEWVPERQAGFRDADEPAMALGAQRVQRPAARRDEHGLSELRVLGRLDDAH